MDPETFKKLVKDKFEVKNRIFAPLRSTYTQDNVGITYSRFRTLFRSPVVKAQEKDKENAKKSTSNPSEGSKRVPDENNHNKSKAVNENENEQVLKPPTDYKALMSSGVIPREEIMEYISKQTGRERLNEFFGKDFNGRTSPEMFLVMGGALQAAFFGGLVAGYIGSRVAKERYTKKHIAAQFETKFFGIRGYYDAILVGAVGFGAKWALRLGAFTGTFLLISQSVSVYRNKTSPLDYAVGGAATGSLFRINMGLRGMFAAGVVGASFGTVIGLLIWGASIASGDSQDSRHFKRVHEQLLEKKRYKTVMDSAAIEYVPPTPSEQQPS